MKESSSADQSGVGVLIGARVVLRPVENADLPRMTAILAEPSVARWWGGEPAGGARELLAVEDGAAFAITVGDELIGAIEYTEENEPDYRHASIDLFLGDHHQGLGYGPDAIRTLARWLFGGRGHHRLTIDPALANEQAIRAYERVGFRRVGVLRQYERGPDGTWHDGLLMDLLREDLG